MKLALFPKAPSPSPAAEEQIDKALDELLPPGQTIVSGAFSHLLKPGLKKDFLDAYNSQETVKFAGYDVPIIGTSSEGAKETLEKIVWHNSEFKEAPNFLKQASAAKAALEKQIKEDLAYFDEVYPAMPPLKSSIFEKEYLFIPKEAYFNLPSYVEEDPKKVEYFPPWKAQSKIPSSGKQLIQNIFVKDPLTGHVKKEQKILGTVVSNIHNFSTNTNTLKLDNGTKILITQEMIEDDLYCFVPGKYKPLEYPKLIKPQGDNIAFGKNAWSVDDSSSIAIWQPSLSIVRVEERWESNCPMPLIYPGQKPQFKDDFYFCEVVHSFYGKSQNGNPMITVEYIVVKGPSEGKTLKSFHILREEGIVDWPELLTACGFAEVDPLGDFDLIRLTGSHLWLRTQSDWVREFKSA